MQTGHDDQDLSAQSKVRSLKEVGDDTRKLRFQEELGQRSFKMKGFYIFVVFMTCYSIASAHILTSAYMNYPSAICKKMLNHALDSLCTYNYESTELLRDAISKEVDTTNWKYLEKVLEVCCMRPCTLPELLSTCQTQ
ncbi:uncharacterized protein LOC131848042 [Achroia grisella]|uniref:uncharacterized protein LOC131848042 n=1 Tax=Achroia grisella TaxID=688607 RepID=UPI0027D1EB55|nr:uncharacterized protein LOC131848042 [Achroia grisella]